MRVKGEDMQERRGMNGERSNAGRKATALNAENAENAENDGDLVNGKRRTATATAPSNAERGMRNAERKATAPARTPRTRSAERTATTTAFNAEDAENAENDGELGRRQGMIAAARRGLRLVCAVGGDTHRAKGGHPPRKTHGRTGHPTGFFAGLGWASGCLGVGGGGLVLGAFAALSRASTASMALSAS